jgi:hypothetical protein
MAPIKKLSYKEEAQANQQIIEIETSFQIPSVSFRTTERNYEYLFSR